MDSDIFQEFWEAIRTYLFKMTNNLVNKPLHAALTFCTPQTSAHIDSALIYLQPQWFSITTFTDAKISCLVSLLSISQLALWF